MTRRIILLPFALLTACSGGADEEKAAEPVALVRTAPAALGASSEAVTIYGAAEAGASGTHALVAQSEGIVTHIAAPTGTAVGAGQVVVTMRPSAAARLDLVKAGSDAFAANAALARAIRLRADGLVSDAEVDAARAAANAANATRASFGARSGTLTLRAPVAGTVQNLTARTGDLIPAGTTVATVGVIGDLRARFGVDPAIAHRLRPGQAIEIEPISGGTAFSAAIVGVDPQADATTRLASLFVRLPSGYAAGPGTPMKARISVGAVSNGVTIPYTALLDDGGKSYVFVIEKGVAHKRDVVTGSAAGDRISITSGVSAGAHVVTEGGTALEDEMKVREQGLK